MGKRTLWILAVILLILACGITGNLIFHKNYIVIDGEVYPRTVTTLDLSGLPVEELHKLPQLGSLQHLDLRDTQLTPEEYESLRSQLPGCEILWLLPFQGSYLPLDTRQVTVTALSETDIELLAYLPQLETVDATGCTDYDALLELKTRYPQCKVLYRLNMADKILDQDSLSFTGTDISEITQALTYLPNLVFVHAEGCTDFDALVALQAQHPESVITYQVPFCGSLWSQNTTRMELNSTTAADLTKILPYLPAVRDITIAQPIPDPDVMLSLRAAYPQISLHYSFEMLGKTVSTQDTHLDFSGIPLSTVEEIEQYVPHFSALEKVDMCGCGIANEEMAALNQRHPDTLFVWEVQLGNIKLRSDITYFMPYQHRYRVTDADADTLKYFTELICIDFGHMEITRTDYLAYMPKMQYLLMCDTPITDISYCANMKDLKYVELFMTNVTDFSPLLECKNLVDLNVCYTYPDDPLIFGQMTQLQTLWFRGMMDETIKSQLRQALPDARLMFGPGSSTGRGWRELPNYYAQRDLMGMPYMTG